MANIENIFRFISLRPTKLEKYKGRLNMYVYKQDNKSSPFYNKVKQAIAANATKDDLVKLGKVFIATANYVKDFRATKFPVVAMMDWITDNRASTFKKANFIASIENIAGMALEDILKDNDFNSTYNNLCDSVLADILTGTQVKEREEKISAIKVLNTLKSVGEKTLTLVGSELIHDFFARSTVVIPPLKATPKQDQPEQPKPDPNVDEKEKEKIKRKEYLENLEKAHRELSNMAIDDKFRYVPEVSSTENTRIKELENQLNQLANKYKDKEGTKNISIASSVISMIHPANQEFILSNKAFGLLSDSSKKVLADFHYESEKVNPAKAVSRIEEEIKYIHSNTEADFSYNKMIAIGGTYVDKQKFTESFIGNSTSVVNAAISYLKKCAFNAGLGDLLIVRQTLKAYELAEFAHVENALPGEFRERVHKRLDVTEVITDTITETETEKERDLQSAERSEMQTEAEKIVQQQAHVDAGMQISGSYGPSISFSASLNAGFSYSVQEAQKKSTSYSREVTEKTSEKVRTKVTEEQRRRILQQIEESNTHRIDNSQGAKHMRGIYRWLNKIYDAQIYNYGQRMMYEFVIPEPASFYLYAIVEYPPSDSDVVKPDLPTFPVYGSSPLKPSNLTRANYNDYVSKYKVINAPEPPSAFTVKTYFDKQDGQGFIWLGRSGAISIPDGYEAFGAVVSSSFQGVFELRVMVGSQNWAIPIVSWGAEYKNFPRKYRGEVSVAVELKDVFDFTLGIDVFCSLTEEAFTKWQLKMYDAIMQAYLEQKAAYDSKMEQKDIQKGVEILGRNPLENRRIEKEELKKLIIMVLTNNPYLNINSYTSSAEPIMDLSKICPNGSFIRFFENAFEWENILYVFYPYFWGRHAKWINAIHLTDPDLDFAAFLKAGAARVQIPVRPGFEKAIAFYCQTAQLLGTGIIWDGNDVPLIDDDLYVPIIKEISENLGKLDDGVYYPDPTTRNIWEVTIPTPLVVLQDLKEIPSIVDMMTKQPININP